MNVYHVLAKFSNLFSLRNIPPGGILETEKDDQIVGRLNRTRGQIDGVIEMYNEQASCIQVVRQIIATRNALTSVARDLLTKEASRCTRERDIEELDAVLAEIFKYN